MLTFIGACAGSTGRSGIKVIEPLASFWARLEQELKQALHPQVVAPVTHGRQLLNHETIRTTNVFMAAYILSLLRPSSSSASMALTW